MDMMYIDLVTFQDAIWGHFHAHSNFSLVVIFMRYTHDHSYTVVEDCEVFWKQLPLIACRRLVVYPWSSNKKESIVAVNRLLHGHAAVTHHLGCKIQSLRIQVEHLKATPQLGPPKEQPIDDLDVGGDLEDDWGVEDDEESRVVGGWSR